MKLKIFKYDIVESTNLTAINLIKNNQCQNGFVHALSQTKGKGRYGKKWISKRGNFFGTIFFCLRKNYPSVQEFSLINPILIMEVISSYCGEKKHFLNHLMIYI